MSVDTNALLGLQYRQPSEVIATPVQPIPTDAPLTPEGLARRSDPLAQAVPQAPAPAPEYMNNPYAEGGSASEFQRGVHKGIEDTVVGLKDVKGAVQLGLGHRDDAVKTFQDAKAQADKAAEEGPHVGSFEEAKAKGDYGDYVAGLAGEAVPTLATMLVPGGIGGKLATKTVEKGAVRAAEGLAAKASERALAEGATEEGAAALATATKAKALDRLAPYVKDAAEGGHQLGEAAGATVGGFPGAVAGNADQLANAKPEDLTDTTNKVLIGSLASSAIGAVPAVRLLGKAGETAVKETTESFIPRVAKEFVKQGATAGAAGVGQTAATLATHKWVGDNLDLLSPQAFNQYLDSFVGGGIIGGITGGGVAGFKGAHVPHLDLDGVKKTLKDNFDRFSDVGKPAATEDGAGQPAQGGGGEQPNSVDMFKTVHGALSGEARDAFAAAYKHTDDPRQSTLDALQKAFNNVETKTAKQSLLREMGKHVDEAVETESEPQNDLGARSDEMLDRINNHETIDDIADTAHERFMAGADSLVGDAPRSTNPVKLDTPMTDLLARYIPADHPIWHFPETVQKLADSTAKMLSTGEELTPKDTENLNTMRQIIGDRQMALFKSHGPEFAKLTEMVDHVSKGADEAAPESKVTTEDDAHEPTQGVFEKSLADMPHNELSDRLVAAEPGSGEHTALKAEFKQRIIDDNVFTENKKGNGPAKFAEKAASPGTVEIAGTKTPWGPRRRLLDVGNMISKELQRNPGSGKAAVAKVMGDLALAGIKVKPESIKKGTWYKSRDKTSEIKLTGRDVQDLRRQAKTLSDEEYARAQKKTRSENKRLKATPEEKSAEEIKDENLFDRSEHENASTKDVQAESVPREEEQHVLAPKTKPPGDKGGGVADVEHVRPYDKLVNQTLKARGAAKSPAERARIGHEAGVRIGTAELNKTETNPRTLARKLAALNDINSGESARYFKLAKNGKFDTVRAFETKADEGKITGRDKENKGPESKMPDAETLNKKQAALDDKKTGTISKADDGTETAHTSVGDRKVDTSKDVPLGGSSGKDGTIYLQRGLDYTVPNKPEYSRIKGLDVRPFWSEHEAVEAKAENEGANYSKAHYDHAEPAEHALLLKKLGLEKGTRAADEAIKQYEAYSKELLKQAAAVKNPDVPKDLIDKPYQHPHNVEQRKMLAEVEAGEGKDKSRADDDINVGFEEAGKPTGHNYAKETKMVNAVLERIAFKGPKLTVRAPRADEKVSGGLWLPKTNEVVIADHLTGPERVEVIAHELGHHVIVHELGEALEKATPELRSALVKDFQKWMGENYNSDSKVSDVLASRKAFFRAMGIRESSTGLRVGDPEFTSKVMRDGRLAPEYLYDLHEYLADHFSRALTQSDYGQNVIEKFFKGIAQKLRDAYDVLFGEGEAGPGEAGEPSNRSKYAPAESVDKWVKSLFDRNVEHVREATGQSVPAKVAESYVRAANHAADPSSATVAGSKDYKATKDYVLHTLSPDERGILSRALDRRPIESQIRQAFGHDDALMRQLETPEERIATQFWLANKLFGEGKLDLRAKGPLEAFLHLRNGLLRLAGLAGNNDKAMQLFIDTRNGEIAKARKGGIEKGTGSYNVDDRVNPGKKLQAAFNTATRLYWSQVFHPFRRIEYGPGSNVHYSYTPALAALGAKLKLHTGEAGNDHGYLPAVETQRHLFNTDAGKALGHLTPAEQKQTHQFLQTRTPLSAIADAKLRKAVADTRKLMRKALGYGQDAGLKLRDLGENFYPVSMDQSEVRSREAEFRELISQPKFEQGFRDVIKYKNTGKAKLIDQIFEHAAGTKEITPDGKPLDPWAPPEFKSLSHQLMRTIYDHGSPEDIQKFASFQKKTPDEVITPYMHALVKRAEYARRFGDDGAEIKRAFEAARKQGVHEADIKHVEEYIASATGAYGADGSPIVSKFFGDAAGKWFGKADTKAKISMLMAYENVRLLPLALLSSIADPMGIGVRYGGVKSMKDFGQAWKSFSEGFRAMSKGLDKTGLRDQATIIGMADDFMKSDIAVNGYSPGLEGFARKVSDWMFKVNGLNWFIKSTRYMALSAANAFLLKHAAHLDPKHSARYLQELGVQPSDIRTAAQGRVKLLSEVERQSASAKEVAADDRVRNALNRFVNEAILRTDASQHPIYMNDPAFRLLTQYKQFAHAFSDQIIDRIIQEAHYSNYHVFAPAVGYIPVTVLGEMTRSFIQYGAGGNPNQADWDALDWAAFAGNRSGLLGPRVTQGLGLLEGKAYAGMGRMVELGPAGEQLEDVLKTLEGHRSVGSMVVESLPAGNVLKHW